METCYDEINEFDKVRQVEYCAHSGVFGMKRRSISVGLRLVLLTGFIVSSLLAALITVVYLYQTVILQYFSPLLFMVGCLVLGGVAMGLTLFLVTRHLIKYQSALEDKNRQLTLLYDISRTLSGFMDSDDVYHEVLEIVGCMSDYHESVLMLYNDKTRKLKVVATYGVAEPDELMGMQFSLGEGVSGNTVFEKNPIYVPNTAEDSRYLRYKGRKTDDVALLSVPLFGPDGDTIVGVINVSRPVDQPFSSQEQETVQAVANVISFALTNAWLYSQVKELSIRDELTGLYNRRNGDETIAREIKRASRFNRNLTLLLIDIDRFKRFNDRYGHPEGDKVLQEFASLIENSVRDVDYVVRWGGEEFIILLPNTGLSGGLMVAEKIRRNVKEQLFPTNRHFSVSIGLAVYPDSVTNGDDLIACADKALYKAKGSGRDRVVVAEAKRMSKKAG